VIEEQLLELEHWPDLLDIVPLTVQSAEWCETEQQLLEL